MKATDLLIIGGIGIAALIAWKIWKGGAETIGAAAGAVGGAIGTATTELSKPVAPSIPEVGIQAPNVAEMMFPPLGIPKFIENFGKDNTGNLNPLAAPLKAVATVALMMNGKTTKNTLTKATSGSMIKKAQPVVTAAQQKQAQKVVTTALLNKGYSASKAKAYGIKISKQY